MFLNNLKLNVKLLTSFILIALLSALVGIVGIIGVNNLYDSSDLFINNKFPGLKSLLRMKAVLTRTRITERNFLIKGLPVEEIAHQFDNYKTLLDKYENDRKKFDELIRTNEENILWEKYNAHFNIFIKNLNDYVKLADDYYNNISLSSAQKEVIYMTMRDRALNENRKSFANVERSIDELTDYNEKMAKQEIEETIITKNKTTRIIIIFTIVIFLLAVGLGLYISIIIIKHPVNKITQMLEKIRDGDLREGLTLKSNDEIGMISKTLNSIVDARRNEISDLLDKTQTLSKSSEDLFILSQQTSTSSTELLNQLESTARASEEILENINSVSSSSEGMNTSIKEISKNTGVASHFSNDAKEQADHSGMVMNQLEESTAKINNIIKIITSIADQTNLLALNATIEAARAGEAGKGFAVVANEVKELAKQSAKATEEIKDIILTIQNKSADSVKSIKEIILSIEKVNDITNTIASSIEEQAESTSEINKNLNDATKTVNSMVNSNSTITIAANNYASMSQQLKDSSTKLKEMSINIELDLKNHYKF